MKRTEIRELAFQLIYSIEVQKDMQEEQLELFFKQQKIEKKEQIDYINTIFKGIK